MRHPCFNRRGLYAFGDMLDPSFCPQTHVCVRGMAFSVCLPCWVCFSRKMKKGSSLPLYPILSDPFTSPKMQPLKGRWPLFTVFRLLEMACCGLFWRGKGPGQVAGCSDGQEGPEAISPL